MSACCNNGFKMIHEVMDFKMWLGLIGPAGPAGSPGRDVQLRGPVATVYDLPVTAPASELWQVGTQAPYNGYFFNGTSWVNLGPVAAGATFTPSVSADGTLSWTNDGGLPNPQSVNIKGPQGQTGQSGPAGPAGPGVPPGGTAGQVLAKTGPADYATGWQDPSGGDVTADMLGIVIEGNSTPVGASTGQYVIVKASTISGITDGLYTAAQAIPANTAIDSTYLTAVSDGGLNDLNRTIKSFIGIKTISISNSTIYKGIRITASVSSGYKFLSWLPTGASIGWMTSFPIYVESPQSQTTGVFYEGTIDSGSDKSVRFSFLEILDL